MPAAIASRMKPKLSICLRQAVSAQHRWVPLRRASGRRVVPVLPAAYMRRMIEILNDAPTPAELDAAGCSRCQKPLELCVCDGIEPIDNKVELLILQHPQEQDKDLGTARLTTLQLKKATMKIGLSWPSLTKILGRPVDPQRWAILYLGSVKADAVAPGRDIVVVDKKGEAVDNQDYALRGVDGIVLLDGTWSQAKALWWRNAWMLKCRRVVLGPQRPSRYGKLRREPRRDGLSTLEAAAMLLGRLEGRPDIETALTATFERLLQRYRDTGRKPAGPARRRYTARPKRAPRA
jgi:DTW domain-containing protein